MEDRYSVLVTLSDQSEADGFHKNLNGKKFAPSEVYNMEMSLSFILLFVHLIVLK